MNAYDQQFRQRASRIPFHGIGLSVDVYSPPLIELVQELNRHQLPFGYLEIFKAPVSALHAVLSHVTCPIFEYHADGLWVTQPDLWEAYPLQAVLEDAICHFRALDCHWITQECATKQMAGYSFGTYLPPLLTGLSAEVTASNVRSLQDRLDADCKPDRPVPPFFLLETPPLTYFACGDLSYMEFFRTLTSHSPCGLVLDIGHLWTVYRYGGYAQTQEVSEFVEVFLSEFPLHRVVQIHIAGLGEHARISMLPGDVSGLPPWIDTHDAPIPDVLFAMLEQILVHCDPSCLKGVALEADTKPIPRIINDFAMLREKLSGWEVDAQAFHRVEDEEDARHDSPEDCLRGADDIDQNLLHQAYGHFVKGITNGLIDPHFRQTGDRVTDLDGVRAYSQTYLPFEILEWGGKLREMFPMTCEALQREGVELSRFLSFWFHKPRLNSEPFDFFLLKVQWFVEFVQSEAPGVIALAEKEAVELREAYDFANQL